ncbi:hypothetical protein GJAV_G00057060 [Gymnothorax javanicus]|nr:hypothetical protein GJAV_G00057060 [Gymnothorax javanicus]
MSQIPMGKVLIRNIIRHTDAHNKILEESEMWKQRDLEKQAYSGQVMSHKRKPANMYRGHMHCDRILDETPVSARDRVEDREARYLTRKLYEFEASDPNRWGHSGFKELYPEDFESEESSDGENLRLRRKRGKASLGSERHKHSKKSSHKKKKKKEKKKRKEQEEKEEEGRGSSSSERSESERRKQRRKSGKSKHKSRRKKEREREREEESGSEGGGDRRQHRQRKRRRKPASEDECRAQDEPLRKRRKDWKVANEENSEESSED